jgi:HK97 gp10 family phage protein
MLLFDGLPEMRMAFQALVEAAGPDVLEESLQGGAMLIQNDWKERAPIRTGTYRRSIHIETEEKTPAGCTIAIGTDITDPPYPVYLELGTRHMAARPSAQPAFDETGPAAQGEVERLLGERAAKVAR